MCHLRAGEDLEKELKGEVAGSTGRAWGAAALHSGPSSW